MNPTEAEALMARMRKLERRLQGTVAILVLVVAALVIAALGTGFPGAAARMSPNSVSAAAAPASQPTVLRAQKVQIVDANGRVRISFDATAQATSIVLFDGIGKRAMEFTAQADGQRDIALLAPQPGRVGMGAILVGAVLLRVAGDGRPALTMRENGGKTVFSAP